MTLEIQVQDKDRHKYVAGYNHPPPSWNIRIRETYIKL
jgi:hypothetical protein